MTHYNLLVSAGDLEYQVNIDVQSSESSNVKVYCIEDFKNEILDRLNGLAVDLEISRLVSRRWDAIILKNRENWPKKEIKEKATMQQGIVELDVQDRPKILLNLDQFKNCYFDELEIALDQQENVAILEEFVKKYGPVVAVNTTIDGLSDDVHLPKIIDEQIVTLNNIFIDSSHRYCDVLKDPLWFQSIYAKKIDVMFYGFSFYDGLSEALVDFIVDQSSPRDNRNYLYTTTRNHYVGDIIDKAEFLELFYRKFQLVKFPEKLFKEIDLDGRYSNLADRLASFPGLIKMQPSECESYVEKFKTDGNTNVDNIFGITREDGWKMLTFTSGTKIYIVPPGSDLV
uniref:SIR2-like domain-containing protein n=1 Tax=Acrobeloides nanus TaxID=290746 RepID=A0A914CIB3_9BILA